MDLGALHSAGNFCIPAAMRHDGTESAAHAPEKLTIAASDGFALAGVRWLPKGAPRAILQLSHGMSEYAARYAPFATACAAAGIAVYGHDHRGHGGSVDANTPLGHYADADGFAKVVGDLLSVNSFARAKHAGVPVFFFGHSMGSFIGRRFLIDHASAVDGAILSATGWRLGIGNRVLKKVAQRDAKNNGPRAPSPRMHKLVFGTFNLRFRPARTPFDWLSREPSAVDAYIADPLCGFDCSGQLWADLMAGVYAVEKDENDAARLSPKLPLMLLAGTHDPVSMGGFGHGQLADRYKKAGNSHVTDKRYEEGRHELLNDTNRAEVTKDILGWLSERIGAKA